MSWLTPMTALYAGLVAVPTLLLFYFLKLKRQEKVVASTLLWKRAVQDLQVNAPFQRLRRNILLLLQMLALLALLAALAGPVMQLDSFKTERYVVMIDHSASMNAVDVKPSRLEEAKAQAKVFVESLTEKSFISLRRKAPQVMVIAIDEQATIVCNFTSDYRQLANAIDQIKPGDGGTNLEQGLALARAYCQGGGSDTNGASSAAKGAQLVLFSDGRVRDAQNLAISAGEMIFQSVGLLSDNVAITAMKAKRSFEDADQINVFAKLTNYNEDEIETTLELSINNDVKAVKTVTVPGRVVDEASQTAENGEQTVDFAISSLVEGVIEVRLLREDMLEADNAAWSVVSAPRDVKVLLVSDGNAVLESALKACGHLKLFTCSKDEFKQMDPAVMALTKPYDVIVLDGHDGADVGRGCYLVFGKPPKGTGVETAGEKESQVVIDYRPKHPVLNYVNLDNLFVTQCYEMTFPRDGEVLAEFDCGAAIGLVRRNNSTYLLAGFDALNSNWPFEPGFVLFIYNAVSFLAESSGMAEKAELAVGEPVVLQGYAAGSEGLLSGPGYDEMKLTVTEGGKLRLPMMERVGLYWLDFGELGGRTFAVNLMDEAESDIRPQSELVLGSETVAANETVMKRFNLPIWPYLVAVVLLLVCLEWYVYNSKIRI